MNETQAFNQFADYLKLDPRQRKAAQDCHGEVRGALESAGIISGSFLQGSFRRKTMIRPLRDIDMVALLHARHRGLRSETAGARKAMSLVRGALREAFPTASFEIARHAVQINFGDESFSFDVVPAFEGEDVTTDDVDIANKDRNSWDRSNTRELIRRVEARNRACLGAWLHQARMIKQFSKRNLGGELPGLVSESIAYWGIQELISHPVACLIGFQTGARLLELEVREPTGRDDLAAKLEPSLRDRAQKAFAHAADLASEARRLSEDGEHAAAIEVWGKIFGKGFPQAEPQSISEAFAASIGGSVTTTGRVARTARGHEPIRPVRPWGPSSKR